MNPNELNRILHTNAHISATLAWAEIIQSSQHLFDNAFGISSTMAGILQAVNYKIGFAQLMASKFAEVIGPILNAQNIYIDTIAKTPAIKLLEMRAVLEKIQTRYESFSPNWEDVHIENDSIVIDGEEVTQADIETAYGFFEGNKTFSDIDAAIKQHWEQLPFTVQCLIDLIRSNLLSFVSILIAVLSMLHEKENQQQIIQQELPAIIMKCLQDLKQSALSTEACEETTENEGDLSVEPPLPDGD